MRRRFPVCSIVPGFILREIAKSGDQEDREVALNTIAIDGTIRAARLHSLLAQVGDRPLQTDSFAETSPAVLRRSILDAKGTENVEGLDVVRAEGKPALKDPAVNEAYDGFGATHAFYWQAYRRQSIDDNGLELEGVVNFGQKYDNAMWDGQRMIFGNGDDKIFKRLTLSLDVIGHELTHGVTQDTAGLHYLGESGALNESVSDVFGSLVKQYHLKQTADQADWLIGADVIGPAVKGKALRSMAHPGTAYSDLMGHKDPQPDHMKHYVKTKQDNGGVHLNSGIPNRAFYLVATELGGHAWEKAGRIWYETLRDPNLRPTAQFHAFAVITVTVADRLFGVGSNESKAVKHGWDQVGVAA
jgi:Zn-dependent metalloprotease